MSLHSDRKKLSLFPSGEFRVSENAMKAYLPYSSVLSTYYEKRWAATEGPSEGRHNEIANSVLDEAVSNIPVGDSISDLWTCPYCCGRLNVVEQLDYEHASGISEWTEKGEARQCENCEWWIYDRYHFYWNKFGESPLEKTIKQISPGIVYSFDVRHSYKPLTFLRKQVVKKNVDLCSLRPRDLELLVGSVFRDFYDCKVRHIGGPGDEGIDLLLLESDSPRIVQVKRRKDPLSKESVDLVRTVLGALVLAGCEKGIIVSTAKDYSKPAKLAAAKAREMAGVHIDLVNRDRLLDILALSSTPEKPWRSIVDAKYHSHFKAVQV